MSFRLTETERARLDQDGYLVREAVFDAEERARIGRDCEALVADLAAAAAGTKHVVGAYMFELRRALGVAVKWEPDHPDLIQGVEPLAHFCPPLRDLAFDPRFTDPAADLVGQADVDLFTEKLNLKRARQGGRYILHQDAAYWRRVTDLTPQLCTAMLMIDDANQENGCLEVAPGSHREGLRKCRGTEGADATEMDAGAFDVGRLVPVEAPAGSVVFFGAYLVHRSSPNRSDADRRALLFSYQPAGNPHSLELTLPAAARTADPAAPP